MPDIQLAVFDMDGVIVRNMNSWKAVHDAFGTSNEEGVKKFMAGEIDDHEFIWRDVQLWKLARGEVRLSDVEKVLSAYHPEPGAADLFGMLHRLGITTAIVSGGLEPLANRIGLSLGVDHVYSNGLIVDEKGFLTGGGRVGVPLREKGGLVSALRDRLGLERSQVIAFGDTSLDVPMFREAGAGFAVDPKDDEVRAAANYVVPDLRGALPIVTSLLDRNGGK